MATKKSKHSSNSMRAARKLQRVTDLTYAQALARIRAAREAGVPTPDLTDSAVVDAFLSAASPVGGSANDSTVTTRTPVGGDGTATGGLAALRCKAGDLDVRVGTALREWDARDEVDTTLGVELSGLAVEVVALLAQCPPPADEAEARRLVTMMAELSVVRSSRTTINASSVPSHAWGRDSVVLGAMSR